MANELTLVAKYTSFVAKAQDILKTASAHQWAPATAEFIDIAKQGRSRDVREVGDVLGFLGGLQVQQSGGQKGKPLPPSSLQRVNLFAHGDRTGISLNGGVLQPKGDHADVTMADGNGRIDANSLDKLENQSDEQKQEAARVFAKGGGIFLYVCESGVHEDVMQRLANYFRVEVHGFRDAIEYCPMKDLDKDAGSVPRGDTALFYKLGETSCNKGSFDFHSLTPSVTKSPHAERPASESPKRMP